MNKIDEYKNKINWDIWADITKIKCSFDGGELGSTGRDRLHGELSDDSVIGQTR